MYYPIIFNALTRLVSLILLSDFLLNDDIINLSTCQTCLLETYLNIVYYVRFGPLCILKLL
jgi:hypothetical protein